MNWEEAVDRLLRNEHTRTTTQRPPLRAPAKMLVGAQVSPPPYGQMRMEQKDAKGTKEGKREEVGR